MSQVQYRAFEEVNRQARAGSARKSRGDRIATNPVIANSMTTGNVLPCGSRRCAADSLNSRDRRPVCRARLAQLRPVVVVARGVDSREQHKHLQSDGRESEAGEESADPDPPAHGVLRTPPSV
jgi:hypothetical protein